MRATKEYLHELYEKKSPQKTKGSLNIDDYSALDDGDGLGKKECSICGGLGYIVPDVPPTHPQFGRAVPCECYKRKYEDSRSQKLMDISGLGGLQECTFANFVVNGLSLSPLKQKSLSFALGKAVEFAQNPQGWLLFQGGYGCGKTHLAAAIANFRIGAGFKTLFVNTPDLLDHLRATYNASSNISYDKRFEQVRTTPLLILDDLGMQSNTEWTKEKLYQIFNYRYSNRLPTVITTNEELETIEPRIRSRIVDRNLVSHVKILAPDFRRPFDDKDPSDLSSLYLHEDKTFDRFDISWPNTKKDRDNLRKALNRSQEFAVHPEGWLVLYSNGGYHNGKTHLAAAIANYVAAHGESVIFVYVADLLDHLRATFHPSSGIRYDRRFDEVKNVSLLVLDDLGTENASGWAREKLYQLFNHRYAAKLPTIITTSLNIEDEVDMKLSAKLLDGQLCIPFRIQVKRYQRK